MGIRGPQSPDGMNPQVADDRPAAAAKLSLRSVPDAVAATLFQPTEGAWVLAPDLGMSRPEQGDDCMVFRIKFPEERRYQVHVEGEGSAAVYVFSRGGINSSNSAPVPLSTLEELYTAFSCGGSVPFPSAFSIPASLLTLLGQHSWSLESQAPVRPALAGVGKLPEASVYGDASTAPTTYVPSKLQANVSVAEADPEKEVARLTSMVEELEAVSLRRPAQVFSGSAVKGIVQRLLPYAKQIIPVLRARLVAVQTDLVKKNNSLYQTFRLSAEAERRVLRLKLQEVEGAVQSVNELLSHIPLEGQRDGFLKRFFGK